MLHGVSFSQSSILFIILDTKPYLSCFVAVNLGKIQTSNSGRKTNRQTKKTTQVHPKLNGSLSQKHVHMNLQVLAEQVHHKVYVVAVSGAFDCITKSTSEIYI